MTPARLTDYFDAVVMLTWSNWKTEPRSNRYHYATRFGRSLPVLFVQPSRMDEEARPVPDTSLVVEPTASDRIELVHFDTARGNEAASELVRLIRARGIRRVLVWVYNTLDFTALLGFLRDSGMAFFVYHATEDYFTRTDAAPGMSNLASSVKETGRRMNVILGVSEGVTEVYRRAIGSGCAYATVENGCDAAFAAKIVAETAHEPLSRPAAIFQGGINPRLNFELLHELVHRLPHWDFWFCGRETDGPVEWKILKTHPNVKYFGELSPEALGRQTCQATVGIIPYVQDQWIRGSYPLKAFEYVSYGLPVVTVPVDALRRFPELFTEASDAAGFALAIESSAATRNDPEKVAQRLQLAESNSYDKRFDKAVDALLKERARLTSERGPLNIVVLYDDRSTHVATIREHLEAFARHSKNRVFFLPATGTMPDGNYDLSIFDVAIVHFSVRLSLSDHLNAQIADRLETYGGVKILFIQDEYDRTEFARRWLERLEFHVVYTCVPESGVDLIYPRRRFPGTTFLPTLTGYVPEDPSLDQFALPVAERPLAIAYRGRKLPYFYGRLGFEKYRIGVDVKRYAIERLMAVDIEVEDSRRIYGDAWYRLLGSARATLGTESGASIFDFTGEVEEQVRSAMKKNPDVEFDDLQETLLSKYEGPVQMNQISPKVFEAIRLRTALILYDGSYSGIVEPDRHYIPLRKDCSNIQDVLDKLDDLTYLVQLTTRAYEEIVASGCYSYRRFVEGVDDDIGNICLSGARYQIYSTPVVARATTGGTTWTRSSGPLSQLLSDRLLGGDFQRGQFIASLGQAAASEDAAEAAPVASPANGTQVVAATGNEQGRDRTGYRLARRVFRMLPTRIRDRLAPMFRR